MPDLGEGVVFAGHRIEGVAGRGGMGTVYRATHIALDHMVALKVIAHDLADDGSFRERFRSESRIAVSLRHPNVVPIHNAGEEDGLLFVTMDLIDGPDLRKLLTSRGPLEPEQAVAILEQVAAALDVAHSRGLVHRDIKPGNVLIEDRGGSDHAYLTDFGLTKRIGQPSEVSALTSTGAFVGTLDYVAPEQIRGEHLDARTDVYALGCVLYEVLTSQPPFSGREEKVAKMYAHLQDDPEPLGARAAPLAGVVERAMAKDRDDRFPSAGDMARAAQAALEGGEVAEAERSVATGPAAPTEVYETPREILSPAPPPEPEPAPIEPTVESEALVEPTAESEVPVEPTAESELPAAAAIGSEVTAQVPTPAPPAPPTARDRATAVVEPEPDPTAARKGPPIKLIGGGLAAAVVVVVAIVVLGGGGGGEEGGEQQASAPGQSNEAVQKGDVVDEIPDLRFPVGIAAGDGEVRAANRGDGQLVEVKSGETEGQPRDIGVSTAEDVAFAAGSWWVSSPNDQTVTRVGGDGSTTPITVNGEPMGIAAQGGGVWVVSSASSELTRIEGDGSAGEAVPLGVGQPRGIAFGGGSLWITARDDDQLIRVDPANPTVQEPFDVGVNPKGVAVAEDGRVWVANAGREGGGSGSVSVLDPEAGSAEEVPALSGTMRDVLQAPDDTIWASKGEGSVVGIDPDSLSVETYRIPDSSPEDLAFGQDLLWVTGGNKNSIASIAPKDSEG